MPKSSNPPTAEELLRWAKKVPVAEDSTTDGAHHAAWQVVRVLIQRRAAPTLRGVCKLYCDRSGAGFTEKEFSSFYTCMVRRAQTAFGVRYQEKFFPRRRGA